MSLSEFHHTDTKMKLESTRSKMTSCPSDLFLHDQEFVELLWENGQVVMQGQSNRLKKNSIPLALSSHTNKFQEKDSRDAVISKFGPFGEPDSLVNDFVPSVPSAIGSNAHDDDDIAPWMNYPMEETLQNDYCSELFSEFSGVNLNSLSHNTTVPSNRSSGYGQTVRDSHNVEDRNALKTLAGGSEVSRIKTSQLFQFPQHCQSSVPRTRSRAAEFSIAGSSSTKQDPCGSLLSGSVQKPDTMTCSKPLQPSTSMGLLNFSHFTRPVSTFKSNHQSVDRLRSNQNTSQPTSSSNPMESTVINSASGLKSPSLVQCQLASVPPKVEFRSTVKPPQEVVSVQQSEADSQDEASKNKHISNTANIDPILPAHDNDQNVVANVGLARHETEKGPEAVVASSSVCSVNGAGAESSDLKHAAKRKNRLGEESGYQSEDLEDEPVGIKKSATGRGTSAKRSRAAEVHNLSERRRRDRINEKMKALQELIPNCNKVDKASMLDEAIEYLKTLQLQVQIMSMGSGLCMPPMMLPAGMQHLRSPPMAHLSPMGVSMGMGMGMGYGMGMLDINGTPSCPMIPVSSMHGPQFPCSSIPGLSNMHGMHGPSSLQMFGIPGQGFPVSMPRGPAFGSLSALSPRMTPVPEIPGGTTTTLPIAHACPSSISKNKEQENMKLETITNTLELQVQTSTQPAKTTSFEQSALAQMSSQTMHSNGN